MTNEISKTWIPLFQDNCSSPISVLTSEDMEEDTTYSKRTEDNILSENKEVYPEGDGEPDDGAREGVEKADLAHQHNLGNTSKDK